MRMRCCARRIRRCSAPRSSGRNCWSLFAPQLLEAASSRFKVEQSLRRAVERGEFELLYQPEVCFETLETHTVEALLRWRQPDGNVIAPADFFEVAEQTGLITDISDWALRRAIEAAAFWQSGPWPQARVAVNISSQQFLERPLRRAPAGAAQAACAAARSAWKSS